MSKNIDLVELLLENDAVISDIPEHITKEISDLIKLYE